MKKYESKTLLEKFDLIIYIKLPIYIYKLEEFDSNEPEKIHIKIQDKLSEIINFSPEFHLSNHIYIYISSTNLSKIVHE